MATFELRRGEFLRDASWRMNFYLFDVRSGEAETTFAVGLSDDLGRQWSLYRRVNAREAEMRAAVGQLKQHLAGIGVLPRHHMYHLLLTAGAAPEVREDRTVYHMPEDYPYEWKECKHRLEKQGEYYCSVAEQGDGWGGRTTLANCEDCGLPSTDIACGNLVHPCTGSSRAFGRPWARSLCDINCELGRRVHETSAAECVPAGRDCWVQTYRPEEAAQGAEPGERLAAEALDMADTLNIIFRNQLGGDLFTLKQFRTGRVLMGPCVTEADMVHKLQSLGDLIDLMNSKELGEAQGVTSEPGSVNWLAAFLQKVAQGDSSAVIQTLRDIRTLRKQLAAHSAATGHFVQACERLGIALPIVDYEGAWYRVLTAFLQALRGLQALIR